MMHIFLIRSKCPDSVSKRSINQPFLGEIQDLSYGLLAEPLKKGQFSRSFGDPLAADFTIAIE